jgi:hypothetical protein
MDEHHWCCGNFNPCAKERPGTVAGAFPLKKVEQAAGAVARASQSAAILSPARRSVVEIGFPIPRQLAGNSARDFVEAALRTSR